MHAGRLALKLALLEARLVCAASFPGSSWTLAGGHCSLAQATAYRSHDESLLDRSLRIKTWC